MIQLQHFLSNFAQCWQIGYALDVHFQGAANEPIPIFQFDAEKKLHIVYFINTTFYKPIAQLFRLAESYQYYILNVEP
jgi:hypothetical protein